MLLPLLLHAAVNAWAGPLRVLPNASGSSRPFVLSAILTWGLALLVGTVQLRRPIRRAPGSSGHEAGEEK